MAQFRHHLSQTRDHVFLVREYLFANIAILHLSVMFACLVLFRFQMEVVSHVLRRVRLVFRYRYV